MAVSRAEMEAPAVVATEKKARSLTSPDDKILPTVQRSPSPARCSASGRPAATRRFCQAVVRESTHTRSRRLRTSRRSIVGSVDDSLNALEMACQLSLQARAPIFDRRLRRFGGVSAAGAARRNLERSGRGIWDCELVGRIYLALLAV